MSVKKGTRMKERNLIGLRSGRLEVIAYDEWKHNRPYLVCKCDCGNVVSVRDDGIVSGRTKSCGCLQKEAVGAYAREHHTSTQNNESRERLHNIWYLMKYRCENPDCDAYHNYGGRGIRVCEEWNNDQIGYFAFKKWALENGYAPNLQIDRINNNGDYTPENCRWTDAVEQANNKRVNVMFTYHGETKTAAQWAKEIGMSYKVFMRRVYLGWDIERIIEQPIRKASKDS